MKQRNGQTNGLAHCWKQLSQLTACCCAPTNYRSLALQSSMIVKRPQLHIRSILVPTLFASQARDKQPLTCTHSRQPVAASTSTICSAFFVSSASARLNATNSVFLPHHHAISITSHLFTSTTHSFHNPRTSRPEES